MKRILILFILPLICMSCLRTTRTITIEKEVPVIQKQIEYKDTFIHDSIYIKDSSSTVYKDSIRYEYVYKNIYQYKYVYITDTIKDSVPVPVYIKETNIETKEINKLKWWQQGLISCGLVSFLMLLIFAYLLIKK